MFNYLWPVWPGRQAGADLDALRLKKWIWFALSHAVHKHVGGNIPRKPSGDWKLNLTWGEMFSGVTEMLLWESWPFSTGWHENSNTFQPAFRAFWEEGARSPFTTPLSSFPVCNLKVPRSNYPSKGDNSLSGFKWLLVWFGQELTYTLRFLLLQVEERGPNCRWCDWLNLRISLESKTRINLWNIPFYYFLPSCKVSRIFLWPSLRVSNYPPATGYHYNNAVK